MALEPIPENILDNTELITLVTKGDKVAMEFLTTVVEILHFWDDLVDGDHAIGEREINARMWQALVVLPRNTFYQRNFGELSPVLIVAIQNWLAANEMEANAQPADLPVSFIIRSSYVDLFVTTAFVVGGADWAAHVTPLVRRNAHRETYPGYLRNLRLQAEAAVLPFLVSPIQHQQAGE